MQRKVNEKQMKSKGGEITISQFSNVPCSEDDIFKDYCAKDKIIIYCPMQYTCKRIKNEGHLTTAAAVPDVPSVTKFPFWCKEIVVFCT